MFNIYLGFAFTNKLTYPLIFIPERKTKSKKNGFSKGPRRINL
jgi:hypothetical protein